MRNSARAPRKSSRSPCFLMMVVSAEAIVGAAIAATAMAAIASRSFMVSSSRIQSIAPLKTQLLSMNDVPMKPGDFLNSRSRNEMPRLSLVQMAGDPVAIGLLLQYRLDRAALAHNVGAARMQPAALWRIERARHLALQHDALAAPLDCAVRHRHSRQQRLGIGVQRRLVEAPLRRNFDDLAEIHHRDAVA